MRYAIFSDIHSNLEALEAVLADLRKQSIEKMVCLGDIVGYNANPRECLEIVRGLGCVLIRGNHDHESGREGKIPGFNPQATAGVLYSRGQIDAGQRAFLAGLPLQEKVDAFTAVHATLAEPERWGYVLSLAQAELSLAYQETPLCFFGHTHVPHLFVEEEKSLGARLGKVAEYFYRKITLDPERRYFINVGSVGQPRDGDWRAAYVIYDSGERSLELRRVSYDVATTQAKIRKAGLPEALAERLTRAR